MIQLSILDIIPRARQTDPETSHAAAKAAEKFISGHFLKILRFLQTVAPHTAHYLEMAKGTGLTDVQIGRRLKSLREIGYIASVGERPLTATGRTATAYRITGRGIEALAGIAA